jgi:hypothetical protein
LQGDLEVAALLTGGDDDAVDDFAQGFRGLAGVVGMAQRFRQALDPAAVDVTDVGMDVGQVGRGLRQPRVEFVLFGFELGQTDRQGAMVSALFDDADDLVDSLFGVGKLTAGRRARRAALAVEAVGFLRIGRAWLRRRPPAPSGGRAGRRARAPPALCGG